MPRIAGAALLLLFSAGTGPGFAQTAANLVENGGFEAASGDLPDGWSVDAQVANQGAVALSRRFVVSGRSSLKLTPGPGNSASARVVWPFGVGQGFRAHALQGKQLYFSSWVRAEGPATAILRIYALGTDGSAKFQEIQQPSSNDGPVLRQDVFHVPDSPLYAIVVFCLVEGASGAAFFDDVTVTDRIPDTWNEALGRVDRGTDYEGQIDVDAAQHIRRIPDTLFGANLEWIWDGNGIWDVARRKLNTSLLDLTSQAGVTLHRFPGGAFADYYSWRDGVGPMALRPQTDARPGGPLSVHRFGTDEALDFAAKTNGHLLITVNMVTGGPAEAAEWVKYVNGAGRRVTYWEVGNEAYVSGVDSITPEAYAARFLQFARAMRAVDPGIQMGAIADENFSLTAPRQFPDWTERVVRMAGDEIDFLSLHCAYAPGIYQDLGWNSRTVYSAMLAAPSLIGRQLADLSRRLDALTPTRPTPIRLAITEWGPYFQTEPNGRFADHPKTLASALFAASTLKTFIESPRTDVANLFKLVDSFYLGAIGVRHGEYTPKASLMVVELFRRHFGVDLVGSTTISPVYDSPSVGWVDAAGQVPYLDVVTALGEDNKLYLIGINKHFDRAIRAHIHIRNFEMSGLADVYTLNGSAPDANTGTELPSFPGVTWAKQAQVAPASRFVNGGPGEVSVTSSSLANLTGDFDYVFPAHSVTSIVLQSK